MWGRPVTLASQVVAATPDHVGGVRQFQSQLASWSQLLVLQKRDFLTLLYELCSDYQIEAPTSAESVILSVSKATVSPPPNGSF